MSKFNKNQLAFIEASEKKHGESAQLSRDEINALVNENGLSYPYFIVSKSEYRVGRGLYQIPTSGSAPKKSKVVEEEPIAEVAMAQVVALRQPKLIDESMPAIPEKFEGFVEFGFYKDLYKIIKSKQFFPVFICGESGNGKTLSVEQACAELNRECIRVNISIETDDSDLLGGPTLVNGNVVNRDGPVITAMKRGAILLIDEVDRGSNKLMCLQGILEGKPYYNKKNGEVVHPAEGFNIVATANTKGQGSDEGRYLAQILDSAFLERFPITVEQEFPNKAVEKKIIAPLIDDEEFVENLVQWADVVRQSYEQGATDEIISTRRLVHIAKSYSIFKDKMKAISLCVARFDSETKTAFIDLYRKIDAKTSGENKTEQVIAPNQDPSEEIPF